MNMDMQLSFHRFLSARSNVFKVEYNSILLVDKFLIKTLLDVIYKFSLKDE